MDPDTAMGGAAARFPETRMTVLAAVRSRDAEERRRALDTLLAAYWKPTYKYLRLKWRLSNEDAKDVTQAFFSNALDRAFFERYDPVRGSFRNYLRLCLDRFTANEHERAHRQKRGGEAVVLPIEFETAEGELRQIEIGSGINAEDFFHDEWVRSVFEIAVTRFRGNCDTQGKQVHYRVFARYDMEEDAQLTYAALAREFGIAVTDVTNYLAWARRSFRQVLFDVLRELTGSEVEFQEEARRLLRG